jgi:glycosyltransferase involved in cell wall biosynthesis
VISIIIPSRNRVAGLVRTLDNMRATTQGFEVELLVVLDEPDTESQQAVAAMPDVRVVLMPPTYRNGHPQEKWQAGYEAAKGEWLAQITDDIEMAPNWLRACLETPNQGFVSYCDPNWCGLLSTIHMCTREYVETVMRGRFGLPWYYVEWADNEWTARAKEAGKLVFCNAATFVHHRHHDSQRELTARYPEKDTQTFHARAAAGFPEEWPTV